MVTEEQNNNCEINQQSEENNIEKIVIIPSYVAPLVTTAVVAKKVYDPRSAVVVRKKLPNGNKITVKPYDDNIMLEKINDKYYEAVIDREKDKNRKIHDRNKKNAKITDENDKIIFEGKILSSSIANKSLTYLRDQKLSPKQKEILVGTVLGDGSLSPLTNFLGSRLSFGHSEAQYEYLVWKFTQFHPFLTGVYRNIEVREGRNDAVMLSATGISTTEIGQFRKMFYPLDTKIVPRNISALMSPLSLGVWIMDDGSYNDGDRMRLCTHSFTEEDNLVLMDMLKNKFNISSYPRITNKEFINKETNLKEIHKYHWIEISNIENQKFSELINPYVFPFLKYKLHSKFHNSKHCLL